MIEIKTVIVGAQHAPGALDALDQLRAGAVLTLQREPQNQYDPKAVAVYHGDQRLGYVPKNAYAPIVERLDVGLPVSCELTGEALLSAGQLTPGGLPRIRCHWQ